MTNWRSHRFALLEFKLEADTAAKMFASDGTSHYSTIGHANASCPDIKEKRRTTNISLSNYLADNEMFDGELTFGDPWPCAKCIPNEKLPKWEPMKEREATPAPPTSRLKPYRTGGIKPAESASDAQVRKLMVLYRQSKPNATKEQIKAAEARAMALTKRDAIAKINELEKNAKPAPTVGATSGITKGSTVTNGTVTGKVFWSGTGKSGALRYGVVFTDSDGTERKVFAEYGWSVLTPETGR